MSSIISRIRRHWANPDSQHRKVALGFLSVGLFVIIGKFAGAAKEMAIAWRYGVSETVDAYVFVLNLIYLPVSLWFSVMCVVLIPLLAKFRQQNPQELPRFHGELLGLTLLIGVALGGATYFLFPLLLETGWLGLSGHALKDAFAMVGPFSMLPPMGVLISFFSASLMAKGHHSNTLLEALPALVILMVLLFPPTWVPEPLIWGTVAGIALQLTALGIPLQRFGELKKPGLHFQSPLWKIFWRSFGIMAAGQALMSFTTLIDQLFAAHLGAGAIAKLGYANRIVALILTCGAVAISRSTLVVFSELASRGKNHEIHSMALRWAKVMFLFSLAAMTVCWWLAPWIVGLLFQRGAFTAEDTATVANLMRDFLLQLPFYFSGNVMVSLLSSQGKYVAIQLVAFATLVIKVIALVLLIPAFGTNAIALSTSMMYAASLVMLLSVSKDGLRNSRSSDH